MPLGLLRFTNALGGTVDFIYPGPAIDMQSPATAGAVDGQIGLYYAQSFDMSQWEKGYTIYTALSGTFSRSVVLANSSGTTAKINFTNPPQVFVSDASGGYQAVRPQGRLTLVSATPVMTTAQNNKTTLYYTSYDGVLVPIYDGTVMVPTAFTELSVLTTDATKSPAAIGASKVNDWFVWNDAGTIRLSHGPDWTSDTARSAGTALNKINGTWLNGVSITNGPAANRGTYVGTTRSNGTSTLDFSFGAAGAGGVAALMNVWNAYNRVGASAFVNDNTGTWNYTAAAVRMTNNSVNNRINFVSGLAEESIPVTMFQRMVCSLASSNMGSGFGLDSTTVYTTALYFLSGVAGAQMASTAASTLAPQLGAHFIQALENSDGVNANTFVGGAFEGLSANFRM